MKKKLFLSLLLAVCAVVFANDGFSQDKRELREQKRQEALKMEGDQVKEMLATQTFFFQADQITWTTNPEIQNVMLNTTTYGVWIYPKLIKVFLPIYGMNDFSVQPQFNMHLDYTAESYSYKVVPNHDSTKWSVEIKSTNPFTLGQYTYYITVGEDGNGTLTLNSPLVSEATFTGSIFPQ